jgi:hypothetical protein
VGSSFMDLVLGAWLLTHLDGLSACGHDTIPISIQLAHSALLCPYGFLPWLDLVVGFFFMGTLVLDHSSRLRATIGGEDGKRHFWPLGV